MLKAILIKITRGGGCVCVCVCVRACLHTHQQPDRLILESIQKSKGQRTTKPFMKKMGDFVLPEKH